MHGPDGPLGTLIFAWVRPHTFDVGEQALMTTLAGYAGQAGIRAQEQRLVAAQTRYQDTRDAMLPAGPVQVAGSVDISAVQELRTQILNAARGGAVPVTVDLDGVDQLASAGVALLFDLRERLSLSLHARPGTPASRVLALTGLDGLLVEADPETERAPVGG